MVDNNDIGANWDRRYQRVASYFGGQPNPWLQKNIKKYFSTGMQGKRVLSVGEGEGQNANYILNQGAEVLAIEPSAIACERMARRCHSHAERLNIKQTNFSAELVTTEGFDLILLFYCHFSSGQREKYHQNLARRLHTGGILMLEGFTPKQMEEGLNSGGPKVRSMLYTKDMLRKDFCSLLKEESLEEVSMEINLGQHSGYAHLIQFVGTLSDKS